MRFLNNIKRSLFLSVGFFAPYMFGHWIIVYTQNLVSDYWWLSYPGFLFLPFPILLVLCLKEVTKTPQRRFDWVMAVVASLSALGVFILMSAPSFSLLGLCVCLTAAAFGQAYMFLKWWGKFKESLIDEVLKAFLIGVIITSLLKMLMSALAGIFIVLVITLPFLSAYMLAKVFAVDEIVVRNRISQKTLKSLWRLGVAVVIFLAMWGFLDAVVAMNAGHYGFSNGLSVIAQCIDIGFAGILLWYIFVRKSTIEYTQLWGYMYACLAFALVMIAFFGVNQIVQVFTGASFQIAHMLILIAAVDITQRTSFPKYLLFIIVEMTYALIDWSTGSLVAVLGVSSLNIEIIASLFFVAIAMLVFFLPQRTPEAHCILLDLNRYIPQGGDQGKIDAQCKALAKTYELTDRELEIMQLLCQGRSKPYIAETLYLSENTIKSYTKNLYKKLNIHSKQELISLVITVIK